MNQKDKNTFDSADLINLMIVCKKMDYLVLDTSYNFGKEDADVSFATNDKQEAIKAAKNFGQGKVVVFVGNEGNKQRIFTSTYKTALGLSE